MNYYIQGNKERADQIKAAFEKLGYNTGYLGFTSGQLYYTVEGKVELMCTKSLQNLIKTHPDYKELELQVESKFKVGGLLLGMFAPVNCMKNVEQTHPKLPRKLKKKVKKQMAKEGFDTKRVNKIVLCGHFYLMFPRHRTRWIMNYYMKSCNFETIASCNLQ